jgi:hypothetical protein
MHTIAAQHEEGVRITHALRVDSMHESIFLFLAGEYD